MTEPFAQGAGGGPDAHEHDAHGHGGTAVAEPPAGAPAQPDAAAHYGLLVEFETTGALLKAAEKVRDAGYTYWDCHTPFPVHGLDKAMGVSPTILPWIILGGGLTGGLGGLFLQVYTNGIELPFSLLQTGSWLFNTILLPFLPSGYAIVVSGKPTFSIPANIPVMFETTVLFSAFTAFIFMLLLNGLPRFYHPLFTNARFRRATTDRFFLSIEAADPLYDRERTKTLALSLGGHVESVEG